MTCDVPDVAWHNTSGHLN